MIIKRKRTEIDPNGFKSGNSKSEERKGPGFYKRSDSSSFVSNHVYNGKKAEHIIAEQTKTAGALSQEAKDEILNNQMNKPYPEDEWIVRLLKEKKALFIKDIVTGLMTKMEHSPLTTWNYREYLFFKEHWTDVMSDKQLVLSDNEFLGSQLQGFYQQLVFEHRNRTAHNTASYMKDVPTLGAMADKGFVYKNYYFRFAILILIDEIFMRMFRKYRVLGLRTI